MIIVITSIYQNQIFIFENNRLHCALYTTQKIVSKTFIFADERSVFAVKR